MVAAHHNVDGSMQFDTGNLRTAQLLHIVDIVNMIVLDQTEYAAHTAHDTGLLTVMDMAASYDMAAHFLLQPAVILTAAHRVAFHLRGTLHMFAGKIVVILFVVIFTQRDTAALTVADLTVLDDPALGPVRSYHTILIGCRRRPCCCGLIHIEATECDITHTCFGRHEAVAAHVDVYFLLIRVLALEVGIDHRLVAVLLGIPLIDGPLLLPGRRIDLALDTLLQRLRLIQLTVI